MSKKNYKTVIPGRVYSFSTRSQKSTEAVVLIRITDPSPEAVFDYILQEGEKVWSREVDIPESGEIRTGEDYIRQSLSGYSEEIQDHFRDRDENLVRVLEFFVTSRRRWSNTKLSYINMVYGSIPKEIITPEVTIEDIDRVLSRGKGEKDSYGREWTAALKLEEGRLPNKDIMDLLAEEQTSHSRSLIVSTGEYRVDQMQKVINFVYQEFPDEKAIKSIPDYSETLLHNIAAGWIVELNYMVAREPSGVRLSGQLMEVMLLEPMGEDGQRIDPFFVQQGSGRPN